MKQVPVIIGLSAGQVAGTFIENTVNSLASDSAWSNNNTRFCQNLLTLKSVKINGVKLMTVTAIKLFL
jgi:hypothetical protein